MENIKLNDNDLLDQIEVDTKRFLSNVGPSLHIPIPVVLATILKAACDMVRKDYLSEQEND